MNQAPSGTASLEALHDIRDAAFKRAAFNRDCAAWLYDAAKTIPQELLRQAQHYEEIALQEEGFLQRVDLSIQAMERGPALSAPPQGQGMDPQRFLRQIDGQPDPNMTTAPGEAARQMGGAGYRAPPGPDGKQGGIGEAEPTPQTVVETVKYEKGEPRPREFTTGHMTTRPRNAQELRDHRDQLRDQAFQKWLSQQLSKPIASVELSLDGGEEGVQVVRTWLPDELEEAEVMLVELQAAAAQDAAQYTGEIAYACTVTFEDGKVVKKALRIMGTFVDPGATEEEPSSS